MKAVIYKRVSSSIQVTDGASLEMQEERLKAYIFAQGWDLTEIYEDAGLSGSDTNRPAFKKMISDAEKGKLDCIVVYKLDRLTRSVRDFHELAEKLDSLKINIVSVTQNLDTSSSVGRLLRNILVDFANFEREMIKERVMDSKYALAEKGVWLGGKTPYGYKAVNKKLVIVPEEIEVIKGMFEGYLKGYSMRELAEEYGKTKAFVTFALRNPVYSGMLGYSKTRQKKSKNNKDSKQRKDFSEMIIARGEHEGIVSEEMFWKVQELRKEKECVPGSRAVQQIFENMCKCECGENVYFYYNKHSEDRIYKTYRCKKYNKGCNIKYKESELEARVIAKLSETTKDKKFWKEVERLANTSNKTNSLNLIGTYKSEMTKNNKTIDNLILHMGSEAGQDIALFIAPQIKKLKARNDELTKLIESQKEDSEKVISIQGTHEIMNNIMCYWEKMTRQEKREGAKILIKFITLGKDNIRIKLNDPNIPELIC